MTRKEWTALSAEEQMARVEQRIAGDFFSESERDIVRDVLRLAKEARADRDACLAVLRAVEWQGRVRWPTGEWVVQCVSCGHLQAYGHAVDCRLAALLAAHGEPR